MRSLMLVLVVCTSTFAKEIPVTPDSLAAALEAAQPNDTLRLAKGRYARPITLGKPLTLLGEAGVLIDPTQPFAPEWTPAPDKGKGVYRAAVASRPYGLLVDGKFLAELNERRAEKSGPWSWPALLKSGPPRSGFRFVKALWIYRPDEKAIYLHLEDDADPSKLSFSILHTSAPLLHFDGVSSARASNLTFAGGVTAVAFTNGASDNTLSDCTIASFEKTGVAVTAASNNRIERNRITRGAYEDWTPEPEHSRERYEVWQIHKDAGNSDRVGVNLFKAGRGNKVLHNTIRLTFDGVNVGDYTVESLDKPLASPDDGRDTEIAHNTIEDLRDSGIELGGGCVDVRVHHNTLRRTHGGLRFKLPRLGPVYIHHNLLIDGSPFNIWFSMDDSPATGYVYHNTIVNNRGAAVQYSFKPGHDVGAPNWHFLNNLCRTEAGFFRRNNDTPVNFTAAHNVTAPQRGEPWKDDPTKDRGSRYVKDLHLDPKTYTPMEDSPAIDVGLDLSSYLNGKPLPGCEGLYFKGEAPDAGALEVR